MQWGWRFGLRIRTFFPMGMRVPWTSDSVVSSGDGYFSQRGWIFSRFSSVAEVPLGLWYEGVPGNHWVLLIQSGTCSKLQVIHSNTHLFEIFSCSKSDVFNFEFAYSTQAKTPSVIRTSVIRNFSYSKSFFFFVLIGFFLEQISLSSLKWSSGDFWEKKKLPMVMQAITFDCYHLLLVWSHLEILIFCCVYYNFFYPSWKFGGKELFQLIRYPVIRS